MTERTERTTAQGERQEKKDGREGEARGRSEESQRGRGEEGQRGRGELARSGTGAGLGVGAGGGGGSPFAFVRRFVEDMDRIFDDFGMGGPTIGRGGALSRGGLGLAGGIEWSPQLELFRDGDELVVRADLPGVKKDDVQLSIDDDVLTICGERRDERKDEREGWRHSERSYGYFERSIQLPEGASAESCDASYDEGVLEVRLKMPESARQRSRRIPIRASGEATDEPRRSAKSEKKSEAEDPKRGKA